jgi:hypothetical protein
MNVVEQLDVVEVIIEFCGSWRFLISDFITEKIVKRLKIAELRNPGKLWALKFWKPEKILKVLKYI